MHISLKMFVNNIEYFSVVTNLKIPFYINEILTNIPICWNVLFFVAHEICE